jgi:sulfur transporter
MDWIKQPNLWQTALFFIILSTGLFLINDYGIGSPEVGLIQGIVAVEHKIIPKTIDHYQSVLDEIFRLDENSSSIFILLGAIVGMIASILIFKEYGIRKNSAQEITQGFFGGIFIGFGSALLAGGAMLYVFTLAPLTALSGFIAVLFMIIGLYFGKFIREMI